MSPIMHNKNTDECSTVLLYEALSFNKKTSWVGREVEDTWSNPLPKGGLRKAMCELPATQYAIKPENTEMPNSSIHVNGTTVGYT